MMWPFKPSPSVPCCGHTVTAHHNFPDSVGCHAIDMKRGDNGIVRKVHCDCRVDRDEARATVNYL